LQESLSPRQSKIGTFHARHFFSVTCARKNPHGSTFDAVCSFEPFCCFFEHDRNECKRSDGIGPLEALSNNLAKASQAMYTQLELCVASLRSKALFATLANCRLRRASQGITTSAAPSRTRIGRLLCC
jgi:hypothetical protein